MASLKIDNLPDEVLEALKRDAVRHSRDVGTEAAERLTQSVAAESMRPRARVEELLRLADAIRGRGGDGAWLTPEFIRAAREEGRA